MTTLIICVHLNYLLYEDYSSVRMCILAYLHTLCSILLFKTDI